MVNLVLGINIITPAESLNHQENERHYWNYINPLLRNVVKRSDIL